MLIVPSMDAIAKLLASDFSGLHIAWGRFLFQSLLLTPLVIYFGGLRTLISRRPVAQVMRGILLGLAIALFFQALRFMPIADAIAIFFIEPLLLTLLSAVFLREPIGWRRLLAIALGFAGALLVIQPSFVDVGGPALLPLGAALFFAIYLTLTRSLANDISPLASQAVTGYVALITLTLVVLLALLGEVESALPLWPTPSQWALVALMGAIASGSHLIIVIAFQLAPASLLAPFQYLEIISATALGLLIFGDFPTPLTWCGVTIIIASGLYVFWRERTLHLHEPGVSADPR